MLIPLLAFASLTVSINVSHADCSSDVKAAFDKLRKSESFRLDTTISNEQGTLTMGVDYVLPDRMHQTVKLSTSEAGAMEMILVGDKVWSNQGQGWAEVPPAFAAAIAKQMKETVVEAPKENSEFACLGEVEFEGKRYLAYRAKLAPPKSTGTVPIPNKEAVPLSTATNLQTVYIDKETGLPTRNIVTTENDQSKRLFDGTFSRPQGLKIEPPKL
jgi:hypothetical protein